MCGYGSGIPYAVQQMALLRLILYFPIANGVPVSPKRLTVFVAAPVALRRMNSVLYPPPSAICGNTIGVGAGWLASATGNVVIRKSPRAFVSDRNVRATIGPVRKRPASR
jgi:hypothetical protein